MTAGLAKNPNQNGFACGQDGCFFKASADGIGLERSVGDMVLSENEIRLSIGFFAF